MLIAQSMNIQESIITDFRQKGSFFVNHAMSDIWEICLWQTWEGTSATKSKPLGPCLSMVHTSWSCKIVGHLQEAYSLQFLLHGTLQKVTNSFCGIYVANHLRRKRKEKKKRRKNLTKGVMISQEEVYKCLKSLTKWINPKQVFILLYCHYCIRYNIHSFNRQLLRI